LHHRAAQAQIRKGFRSSLDELWGSGQKFSCFHPLEDPVTQLASP